MESSLDVLSGGMVDADDWMYRAITGSRGDNLPSYKHERMLEVALYLDRTNPVAQRIVGLLVEFVLGEGVSLSFQNDQVEDVILKHWRDPVNDWERNGPDLLRSYLVTGELLMPLFPAPSGGHMTVGAVETANIKAIRTDPDNWRLPTTAVRKPVEQGGQDVLYALVNHRVTRDELRDAERPALYWKRGNPYGQRGISVLYHIADFIDLLDQMAFSEVERWLLLKAFIWDVSIKGADDTAVKKWQTDNGAPPRPGSVFAHNDTITMEAKSPQLDTYDAVNGMKFLRNHILGGVGLPEHWYSEGGDVNRATATAMAEPTRKMLEMLQKAWRAILTDVLQAQVDYAILYGDLPEEVPVQDSEGKDTDETVPTREAFSVDMPDLSPADTEQVVGTVGTLVTALQVAEDNGYVTHATAQRTFLTLLSQVGVEIKVDEEMERADTEQKERDAEREERMRQMAPQNGRPPTPLQVVAANGDNRTREVGS